MSPFSFSISILLQVSLPWDSCPLNEDNSTISECEDSSETQYFWFRTVLDSTSSIGGQSLTVLKLIFDTTFLQTMLEDSSIGMFSAWSSPGSSSISSS